MLVEHGIFNETAEYRIHVCFGTGLVYYFPVKPLVLLLCRKHYPTGAAYQGTAMTAIGHKVPVVEIPEAIVCEVGGISKYVLRSCDESTKGRFAVAEAHRLYPPDGKSVSNAEDISGTDYWHAGHRIQVKCDWLGGPKERGGTGNLFIQLSESNPHNKR